MMCLNLQVLPSGLEDVRANGGHLVDVSVSQNFNDSSCTTLFIGSGNFNKSLCSKDYRGRETGKRKEEALVQFFSHVLLHTDSFAPQVIVK